MAFTTEGIILRTRNYIGPDRIVDVLTPREGTLAVIARGALRSSSKLAGHLVPFARVRMMIGRGRNDHCAGVTTLEGYASLRRDWNHFVLASSLVDLVLTISVPGSAAHEEFSLLDRAFTYLADDAMTVKQKNMIGRIFLWQLVTLAGWRPNLSVCAACHRTFVTDDEYAYADGKGFVCRSHEESIVLSPALVDMVKDVLTKREWDSLALRGEAEEINRPWLVLTKRFYEDVIGIPLKSLNLFSHV